MGTAKKVFLAMVIGGGVFILLFFLWIVYESEWRITTVDAQISPDGRYTLVLQEVGAADWPFGPSDSIITLKDGNKTIAQHRMWIGTDGTRLRADYWQVAWEDSDIKIVIIGEIPGMLYISYDGLDIVWEEA